jgi:hypothetical protein
MAIVREEWWSSTIEYELLLAEDRSRGWGKLWQDRQTILRERCALSREMHRLLRQRLRLVQRQRALQREQLAVLAEQQRLLEHERREGYDPSSCADVPRKTPALPPP